MTLHPVVEAVTARIVERSRVGRQAYLDLIARERDSGVDRPRLSCGNLAHGFAASGEDKAAIRDDLEMVYGYFPRLRERRSGQAGYTSGGEQQMVAIGRALMSRPKMILLDEPSMGLAPQLVEEIFEIVRKLNAEQGLSFLLAEQNTHIALRYAKYGYILESGRIVLDGEAHALRENEDVKEFYLGIGGEGRRSFKNV